MRKIGMLFCTALLAFMCVLPSMAKGDELKFNKKKKFKIVQFTDVHWRYDNPASEEAGQCMAEVLDAEKPDLVVFTGDVIFSKPARETLDKALEATIKRKIPFAVTWGNHDDEHDMTRKELAEYVATKAGCLNTTAEGVSGLCNFVLPVKSADGTKDAALLYMFDSHSYSPVKEIRGYGWIKHDQVEWYNRTSKQFTEANGGAPLPALAFFHIPLPEFHDAVRNESAYMVGTRKEKACAPEINSGLGNAMLKATQDEDNNREDNEYPRTALLERIVRQVHHNATSNREDKQAGDRVVQLGSHELVHGVVIGQASELHHRTHGECTNKIAQYGK